MATKNKFEAHTMQEKFKYHSDRAFKNHKPAGSKMTKAELAAYSAGYLQHARQTARSFKYNHALSMGASEQKANQIARDYELRNGQFVKK